MKRYFLILILVLLLFPNKVLANENNAPEEVTNIYYEITPNKNISLHWSLPNEEEIEKVIVIRDDYKLVGYGGVSIIDWDVKDNNTYNYKLITVDKDGNRSHGVTYTVTLGNVFAPSGIFVANFKQTGDRTVEMAWWNPADSDFQKNLIYRDSYYSDKEYIGSTSENYFIDKNTQPNYKYFYSFVTVDEVGNKVNGREFTFITSPNTPSNLRVSKISDTSIELKWDKNDNPDEVQYIIYVNNGSKYITSNSTYQLSNLKPNQYYRITVSAKGSVPSSSKEVMHSDDVSLTIKTLESDEKPKVFSDSSPTFIDIVGHWAENDILDMEKEGLVNGKDYKMFYPNANVTRAEFTTFIVRALDIVEGSGYITNFKDVPQFKWYTGAIESAYKNGIIAGYPDDTFKPNEPITREEIAVILTRVLKKYENFDENTAGLEFNDSSDLGDWSKEDINYATNIGLIRGMTDGNFYPKNNASRAESVVMLKRFYDRLDKTPPLHPTIYNKGFINKEEASNYTFTGSGEPGAKVYLQYVYPADEPVSQYSPYSHYSPFSSYYLVDRNTPLAIVNDDGEFSFEMDLSKLNDDIYYFGFRLEDTYGNKSNITNVRLVKDTHIIRPELRSYSINAKNQYYYIFENFSVEKGSQVKIEFSQGDLIRTLNDEIEDGEVELVFDASVFNDGDVDVNLSYIDPAGNSEEFEFKVLKDIVPPSQPTIEQGSISNGYLILKGKGENNSYVLYTISYNDEIVYKSTHVSLSNDGMFEINRDFSFLKNEGLYTIKLWNQDKAGNISNDYAIIYLNNYSN